MSLSGRLGPPAFRVALLGLAVLGGGIGYAGWSTAAEDDEPAGRQRPALRAGTATVEGELVPGGAVTGSLVVRNDSGRTLRVTSARFTAASSRAQGCAEGVVFALTVEPSAATPLVLPAGASASPLGWTAFMSMDTGDACQGARFTSELVLGGHRVGAVTAVAARLAPPGRPVGGLTTPTRAAVRWSAAPSALGYLLERAPSGTTAWVPACGTAAAPLGSTTCTDTGLQAGTAYAYRVTSVRGAWRAPGGFSADVRTQPRR